MLLDCSLRSDDGVGLLLRPYGVFLGLEGLVMGGCCYGEILGLKALFVGCCYGVFPGPIATLMGCSYDEMVAATAEAATVWFFGVKIRHAAAAFAAAVRSHDLNSLLETPAALACEYLCNKWDLHAAVAAAAALIGKFPCIPVVGDLFEFGLESLGNSGSWLCGMVVLRAEIWKLFCERKDPGKVLTSLLGKGKIRFSQKDIKGNYEPSDLQALTRRILIALTSRVGMGTTPTVACPWARGRLQDGWTSPSVRHSRRSPSSMSISLRCAGHRRLLS